MAELPSCAAGVPIFQVLPHEGLADLSAAMRHRVFGKAELVAGAGEPVTDLIVVARGRLKLSYSSASGREQVVRVLEPGQFLGEMALFAPARHEADLIALEESACCLVPRQAMQTIMQRHPDVAFRLVEALARRLADAEGLIAGLGLRDVGQRLAAELVRLAAGEAATASVRVKLPVPWAELAVRLGTTPESMSRRLKALAEQGFITQEGARTVVIHSLERLRRMAEG
jgi:CRP/FNR family transcriptional regulator, anaerobic regulatory protein